MKKIAVACISAALLFVAGNNVSQNKAFAMDNQTEQPISVINLEENAVESVNSQVNLQMRAKSSYLMDYATGTEIYAHNETAHLPIASMCKIMTLLLSFEAIDSGVISMDEEIMVSERAASMGGSQVFLEANAKYPIRELIKSIVVCSANDSCVAMAEKIAGSESLFTDRMNEKAKELGANDTLFANCTGLPKEPQYSCARDVAKMMQALLTHEEYFEFGKVWMDKFQHPKGRYTEISNTNKLVRFYDGCDGGKTGFTNQAGFCLAATAKRENMRIISVVIGEESSNNRFEDIKTMLDYAFANYTMKPIAEANVPLTDIAHVDGGKVKEISACPKRTVCAFSKRGEKVNITTETKFNKLRAPIGKGEEVGEMIVYKDNVEVDRVALLANVTVEKANVWDRLRDVAQGWNARK